MMSSLERTSCMNVENGHTKNNNNETKKKNIIIMELILFHVNGHTAIRPGMACVPLGNH